MKRMGMTMCLILLLAGCGSPLMGFGAGAVAGGALSGTLSGAEQDLERAKQAKITEQQAALERLANATDEVEKAALAAKIKALEKTIETLQDAQIAARLITEGTKTDWTNPEAVGGYGGAVLASLLALYYRRKEIGTDKKYKAANQGMDLFRLENTSKAAELYKNVGDARTKLGA